MTNTRFIEGSLDSVRRTVRSGVRHLLPAPPAGRDARSRAAQIARAARARRTILRARSEPLPPLRRDRIARRSAPDAQISDRGRARARSRPHSRAVSRAPATIARVGYYDFLSSPLAGLFPGWRAGYTAARIGDDLITAIPLLQRCGSNFELVASLPPRGRESLNRRASPSAALSARIASVTSVTGFPVSSSPSAACWTQYSVTTPYTTYSSAASSFQQSRQIRIGEQIELLLFQKDLLGARRSRNRPAVFGTTDRASPAASTRLQLPRRSGDAVRRPLLELRDRSPRARTWSKPPIPAPADSVARSPAGSAPRPARTARRPDTENRSACRCRRRPSSFPFLRMRSIRAVSASLMLDRPWREPLRSDSAARSPNCVQIRGAAHQFSLQQSPAAAAAPRPRGSSRSPAPAHRDPETERAASRPAAKPCPRSAWPCTGPSTSTSL